MKDDGKEVVVEGEVKSQETTLAAKTPTAEEQLKTLSAKLQELETGKAQSEERYKGLQRTVNQKDEELKKQSNFDSRISAINDRIELLATAIASGRTSEEEMSAAPKEEKTKILEDLKRMKQQEEAKKQQNELLEKAKTYQTRTEALGLTPKSAKYFEIRRAVQGMEWDYADFLLGELESKKEVTVTDERKVEIKKETDEEVYQRVKVEKAREGGLLKSEPIIPAGGSGTEQEILEKYNSGRITSVQANEKLRSIGASPIG